MRARQTLAPISEAVGLEDRTQVEEGLYGATAEQLLARLQRVDQPVGSVLVVAHNPGLQDLVIELAGGDPEIIPEQGEKFPTGAMAAVVCECGAWSDLTPAACRVASITVPRALPD